MENDELKVIILPNLGFKIASIYHKNKNFEFLFQPTKEKYEDAIYGDDFSKYDTSGIDDCIPSIDVCNYPDTDKKLVDHGDVWSLKWDLSPIENGYAGNVNLPSIPLNFERKITLNGSKLRLDYTLKNDTNEEYMYLWAFHGLLNYTQNSNLEFDENLKNYINVQNDEIWDFDIKQIKNFKENHTFKYYFLDEIKNGFAKLNHLDEKLSLNIKFDPKQNPYIAVWLTTGGFKGEKNIAIEPCNGFYDSLEKAYKNNKYKSIKPKTSQNWFIELEIGEI